jgi:hypothetical protein
MGKITTRAAGLGACAVLLGGLAAAAPAATGAMAGAAVAGPAAQPGARGRPARAGATGWRRYRVPVKGQANLDAAAAPGRGDAWAGGFTIHNSSSSARGRRDGGSPASRRELSRLTAPGLSTSGRSAAGDRAAGRAAPASASCPLVGFLDTLLLHWNGRTWSRVAAPDVARINYLSAAGPSSAWASGDCGLLGWNGKSWQLASFPMPAPSLQPAPAAVVDVSPGDAWLLGSTLDVTQNVLGSFVDHWNGHRWQSVTLPAALHLASGTTLTAIGAHGPRDVWIAGTAPEGSPSSLRTKIVLLHWNGRSWRRLAQPASGLGYYNSVGGVRVVSATSAWVVGWDKLGPNEDENRLPLALHWNGRSWTTTRMPAGRGELDNVTRADGQVLAVGDTFSPDQTSYGLDMLRWTGRAWVHVAVPASGPGTMGGIAAIPGGGVWVTGSTGDTTGETGDTTIKPLIARRA